eukprot:755205-Hanusia_phi.AAC.6
MYIQGEEEAEDNDEEEVVEKQEERTKDRKAKKRGTMEDDGGILSMEVVRDVARGEEVFNTYGELGSAALLLRYGFVDRENPHDFVSMNEDVVLSGLERWMGRRQDGMDDKEVEEEARKRLKFCIDAGKRDEQTGGQVTTRNWRGEGKRVRDV